MIISNQFSRLNNILISVLKFKKSEEVILIKPAPNKQL